MRFADQTISAFLDALASAEPTPGGGTASAIAGAMGASLLMMVAGLAKTRGNSEADRVALNEARAALTGVRDRLRTLADTDSEAFNAVMAAYRMAKSTDAEKAARKQAIQQAVHGAIDAPLDTVRAVHEAVGHARAVARHGNPSAASDVGVALELLAAAAAGAAANVQINLQSVDDETLRSSTADTLLEHTNQITELVAAARAALP